MIEILIRIKGIEFYEAFLNSIILEPDGYPLRVVNYHDLMKMKKNAGRPKDLDDLNNIKPI
jgi:hypothetical protein